MGLLRNIAILLGSKSAIRRESVERRRKAREWTRYRNYLDSKVWKQKRKEVLKRDNNRCAHCGARATQVHHKWYAQKKGTEPLEALEAICNNCHRSLHGRWDDGWIG